MCDPPHALLPVVVIQFDEFALVSFPAQPDDILWLGTRLDNMELELISAAVSPGEPADCAKVFHLEGFIDLAVLPPPWASTTMSPLRDRYCKLK